MTKRLLAVGLIGFFICLGGILTSRAQTTSLSADPSAPLLSPDDLQQLVAPIALYPDPMIALILTGSTVPTDIVLADRYIQNGGDPNATDSQPWDDSVKGLAHYPDVLKMMDDNLDWTNQLGAAVLAQQADVMTAIQAQRAKAQSLGNLETTAQQQVVTDQGDIQILPADPQVIYVPVYDPTVVYIQQAPPVPFISFGVGFAVGAWIGWDCDWRGRNFYRGGYYRPGYGWGHNPGPPPPVWRPNPNRPPPRPPYRPGRPGAGPGNPGKLPGWHRPPGGTNPGPGQPGQPNRPGQPGGDRPGSGPRPNPPTTRPSIPGQPGNRPGGPGNKPDQGNRPGGPGNRPEHGKPGARPPAETKPSRPAPPATRPAPPTTRPAKPERPTPAIGRPNFDRDKPNTKRPVHTQPAARPAQPTRPAQPHVQPARPQPQARPAPSRPAAPAARPAPQAGGNRGGGRAPAGQNR